MCQKFYLVDPQSSGLNSFSYEIFLNQHFMKTCSSEMKQ
jgi:hypothetical protein